MITFGHFNVHSSVSSDILVRHPTKYFQRVEGEGFTMRPEVYLPLSSGMLFEGENRILDVIYEDLCADKGI